MKLLDILGKVGGGVLKSAIPGGALVVDIVNQFLPDGAKLPAETTGTDLQKAVDALPPAQRAELLGREFDVEEARINANVALMTGAPAQETRAWIAKWAFVLVAFVTVSAVLVWGVAAIGYKDETLVKTITDGWEWLVALLLPFVGWLNRYFGILRAEQRDRLNAGNGSTDAAGAGILSKIFRR